MSDINEIEAGIQVLSEQLTDLGLEAITIANRMYELKFENEKHQFTTSKFLRAQEKDGKIKIGDAEIKLTDAIRDQLSRDGRVDEFAEYEALKRKLDGIKTAVNALTAALSGYQSRANIIKKEMEILQHQPG